jgi:hypothetical protein
MIIIKMMDKSQKSIDSEALNFQILRRCGANGLAQAVKVKEHMKIMGNRSLLVFFDEEPVV